MIKIGILGSTGYAGSELVRLLSSHPYAEIVFLDSRSYENKSYTDIYPHLESKLDKNCSSIDLMDDSHFKNLDLLFCALPHGLSQIAVKQGLKNKVKVIDLSADFRISDIASYEHWYQVEHLAKEEVKLAVYGLCEINREKIKASSLVANPGCYPTSILLALYPLLKEGVIKAQGIIADSKSGISGAGRNLSDANLFSQCNENIRAYSLCKHRHIPEIEKQLSLYADTPLTLQFSPHLIPMNRGILSTIYADMNKNLSCSEVYDLYSTYYSDEYFVRLLSGGKLPQTKAVSGSNYCDIGFDIDKRTGKIIIVSAIDNLIKGASGQAVQNMNLMFGLDEHTGINQLPMWP